MPVFGTRRARCLWCGSDLRAPEVALCADCAGAWQVAMRDGAQLRDRQGAAAINEEEAMTILASPRGLADDWLELRRRRVRVLTQHCGVEIGSDDMGRPMIFETVVHDDEIWVRRYATEDEARAGHALVLAIYAAGHRLRGTH